MTSPPALLAEADLGSASTRGRPPEQHWMVRLRRGPASVIVAVGLHKSAAEYLAQRINELLHPGQLQDLHRSTPLSTETAVRQHGKLLSASTDET